MGRSAGDCGSFLLLRIKKDRYSMANIRLDKYLADAGFGSRKDVKGLLKTGQITVNDVVCKRAEDKINLECDAVCVQGKPVIYESYSYYMLHKPQGVVSATTDKKEKTVIDLITEHKRRDLFPVGRLDKDTEGLLILTNDGKLANDLLAPGKHVKKTYYARIRGLVTKQEITAFAEGVNIGDEMLTAPAELVVKRAGAESEIEITITEGRYHQIKRMFESVGMQVVYLKRLQMGTLRLDETLACGQYRKLTKQEVFALKNRQIS